MQNKTVMALILVSTVCVSPVFATDYGNYDHSQGNDYQCSTSPSQQLECQIENILLSFFPQFLKIGQDQDADLKQIIQNQQIEIELLKNMTRTSYKICNEFTFGC